MKFEGSINRQLDEDDFIVSNGNIGNFERGVPEFTKSREDIEIENFQVEGSAFEIFIKGISEFLAEEFGDAVISIAHYTKDNLFYLSYSNGVKSLNLVTENKQSTSITGDDLNSPLDIEASLSGVDQRLYLADKNKQQVNVYNNATVKLDDFKVPNYDSSNDVGPTGIVTDDDGNIYVTVAFTPDGTYDVEYDKVAVYKPGNYNNPTVIPADNSGLQLDRPYRIAVDKNGRIYIADGGGSTPNGRVLVFDENYNHIHTIEGTQDKIGAPGSIIVDDFGYIYIIDYQNDITFNGIFQNPEDLLGEYDKIISTSYSVNVYDSNANFEYVTEFNQGLNLPIDLEIDYCGNILVNNLKLSGPAPEVLTGIDINFDFQLKTFTRHDNFTAEVTPNGEGLVEVSLNPENEFFPCDPQPECSFSIEYKTEAAPDPTFDCPIESEIDPLFYGNNCSVSVPDYEISNPQHFESDPFLVQTYTENENSVSVLLKVYDGENGDLVDECNFEVDLIDNKAPVISDCPPENIQYTIQEGETHILDDYTDQISVNDNCDSNPTIVQDPPAGTEITADQSVTLIVTDEADNETECNFKVEITEVAVPDPTFDCPVENNLDTIYYDDNCSYNVPKYKISNPQHFDPEPYLIQSHTENGDSVSVTIKVYNGEGGELVDICDFEVALEDNQAPVISGCPPENIQFTIQEGETHILDDYTGQISVNDNCDSNPSIVQDPPAGTEITADRLVTFTVTDKAGNETECNFMVEITEEEPNTAPVAADNTYSIDQNEVLTIPAPGILQNDTDSEDDNLTASLVTNVSNGTLTFNADGSFTYTPNTGFIGSDSFTYKANDGELDSNIATVTINVNSITAPNTAPVAADNTYSIDQNEVLTIPAPGILQNDTDSEEDNLTASLDSDVSNGTLTFNADGSFTYIPNSDFKGQDSFTYRANDGKLYSNIATVTITVNSTTAPNTAPVAVDNTYSIDQNEVLTIPAPGILQNDTDSEEDNLTASLDSDVSNGTLTLNADGSFTYEPDLGYTGQDSFTYTANDGTDDSNVATVTITVNSTTAPNTAPVAENDTYAVDQDEVLPISSPGILQNDTDADGDNLTASLVSDVSNGTLILNADGSFTYTPNSGYVGQDSFTYTANDGTDDSNVATVTITVNSTTAPNTAPVAENDTYAVDQDEVLPISSPGILQNDTDSEGDNLTASLVSDVFNGTLTFNADGSFIYEPSSGFTGQDSFTYRANDGKLDSNIATVTITVTKNDPAAPEINCLNHVIFLDKNGKASLEPKTIYNGDRADLELKLSQTNFDCSNLGSNTVTLIATDPETGLSSLCTAHIEVLDVISPEASCISGYVLELGEDGTASLAAAAIDNNSTDNCSIVSRSVSRQNFTRDDIGDVSVRLTVRDAAGNEGSCESVIKVIDKQTSDFQCKEKVSVSLNENGNATLAVEELYTGDASGINFDKNNYQFSCADLGTKTIQFNYSGRIEGSCSIKVEVKDELAPTINTNLINASLDEDGFFYLDENRVEAEDNCNTPLQITLEKTVFTCEDVGQNSILVEAEDASGIKTSKEITVIVSGAPCEPSIEFNDIRISPNPSAGIFKIGTPTDIKINEVKVFDSRGRFITQKDYNMNFRFYKLNLESLQESVYTLQIFTNNGEFVKRIIIKR
ncbi:Ig-like domain-containing protein [Salegentibacter echinorum]|nr:Ig-like domain-containing protein [Salegentibacter echinorum]